MYHVRISIQLSLIVKFSQTVAQPLHTWVCIARTYHFTNFCRIKHMIESYYHVHRTVSNTIRNNKRYRMQVQRVVLGWNLNVLPFPSKKKKQEVAETTFPDFNLINDGNSVQRNRAAPGRSIRRVQLIINLSKTVSARFNNSIFLKETHSIPRASVETAHKINNQLRSKLTIFRIALQLKACKRGTLIRRAPLDERELSESSTFII